MYTWLKTFTLCIPVGDWLPGSGDLPKRVLCNYLEDVASGMDFRGPASACALESENTLWFTFIYEQDFEMFRQEVSDIWNQGEWLIHD